MHVGKYIAETTERLAKAGVTSAHLDCLILLEDLLGFDRALLLAHPETQLSQKQLTALNNFIVQREEHVPLAYLRGKASFYGRTFFVNNKVLIPRPDTEAMIDLLKEVPITSPLHLADIGTGSGCLGITAALELPHARVSLYDIDSAALKVARQNAQAHQVTVQPRQQHLLCGTAEQFNVIMTNLPYVPTDYPVNAAVRHEPSCAIFAGPDGLKFYRVFWQQLCALPFKPQFVITESLTNQHAVLSEMAQLAGYNLKTTKDLAQAFQLVVNNL